MVGRDVCIIEALSPLISGRRECLTFKRLLFLLGGDCRGLSRRGAVDSWDFGNPTILNYSWTSTE